MSKTFLEIVNDTILESGADLHQFAPDGSDFDVPGHDSLMYKFKTWVARAWQTVQQNAYDWQFMADQAVVNLDPGIMFYGDVENAVLDSSPPYVSVVAADGSVIKQDLPVSYLTDLTGKVTDEAGLGAVTLGQGADLSFGLRPGSDRLRFYTAVDADAYVQIPGVILPPGTTARLLVASRPDGSPTVDNKMSFDVEVVSYDASEGRTYIKCATEGQAARLKGIYQAWPGKVEAFVVEEGVSNTPWPPQGNPVIVHPTEWYPDRKVVPSNTMLITGTATSSRPSAATAPYIRFHIATSVGHLEFTLDKDQYKYKSTNVIVPETGLVTLAGVLELSDFAVEVLRDSLFSNDDATLMGIYSNIAGGSVEYVIEDVNIRFGQFSGDVLVHGWKSFDWSEELQDDDFVENVAEIDQKSFKVIVEHGPGNVSEERLPFVPWEVFRAKYNNASQLPGIPSAITKDSVGRWRLWPVPSKKVTVTFDYVRNPQQLKEADDVPKSLPLDLTDIIMWRALMYYGEYDEQPSVSARATRNFKDLLSRMELRYRGKFHFAPTRLW